MDDYSAGELLTAQKLGIDVAVVRRILDTFEEAAAELYNKRSNT